MPRVNVEDIHQYQVFLNTKNDLTEQLKDVDKNLQKYEIPEVSNEGWIEMHNSDDEGYVNVDIPDMKSLYLVIRDMLILEIDRLDTEMQKLLINT